MPLKFSSSMTTRLRTPLKLCGIVTLGLILTNCSKVTLGSESECKIFQPIMDSKQDTQQTRIEIRIHNDIGQQVCGWKPPK